MDLQHFRASGRDVANLGWFHPGLDLEGKPGRVYEGGGYMERRPDGTYYLQIDRSEYEGTLDQLEPPLHQWMAGERCWEQPRFDQLRREHPDFDLATLPAIPLGWEDTSWHNDACPSFQTPNGVRVYVDYADPAQRELGPTASRFGAIYDPEDGQSSTDTVYPYEGDDWDALLEAVGNFTPCRQHTDTGRGVCADCGVAL